jgi:hypothetical protein
MHSSVCSPSNVSILRVVGKGKVVTRRGIIGHLVGMRDTMALVLVGGAPMGAYL